VNFREIPSHVLSKVCVYFTYKVRYTNSSTEIPEFPIDPKIVLELLMAVLRVLNKINYHKLNFSVLKKYIYIQKILMCKVFILKRKIMWENVFQVPEMSSLIFLFLPILRCCYF
jgi:hypothetical protein